jgi:hypothetical protein
MEDDVMQDVYLFFSGERVNVELMFNDDPDMGPLITARGRKWKGSGHENDMVLAGGLTSEEALFHLARGLLKEMWIPLEWSQRARVPGNYLKGPETNGNPQASQRRKALSEALFGADQDIPTPITKKVAKKPLQEHTEAVEVDRRHPGFKP